VCRWEPPAGWGSSAPEETNTLADWRKLHHSYTQRLLLTWPIVAAFTILCVAFIVCVTGSVFCRGSSRCFVWPQLLLQCKDWCDPMGCTSWMGQPRHRSSCDSDCDCGIYTKRASLNDRGTGINSECPLICSSTQCRIPSIHNIWLQKRNATARKSMVSRRTTIAKRSTAKPQTVRLFPFFIFPDLPCPICVQILYRIAGWREVVPTIQEICPITQGRESQVSTQCLCAQTRCGYSRYWHTQGHGSFPIHGYGVTMAIRAG
jgi:hypothetical protein